MSVRRIVAFVAIASLGLACSRPASPPRPLPSKGSQESSGSAGPTGSTVVVTPPIDPDWPPPYDYIRYGLVRTSMAEALERLPFDHIEMERTSCFGSCPVYTVTFHRDGTATYEGGHNAPRQGRFRGSITPYDYGRLCFLIESSGFLELEGHVGRVQIADAPTVRVSVASDSSGSVSVTDDGNTGPITLWAIQVAIDTVATRVRWEPAQ